jgi:hypothetical protein
VFGGNHIDRNLARRAILSTSLREQDSQRIQNLRTSSQRISGTVGTKLLANGDGWGQSGDTIGRRSFNAIKKLAG